MTIEYQLQQFPFRSGLDQGQDPKQVPPGTMKSLVNLAWVKGGRLEKRAGAVKYGSGFVTGAKRLAVRGQELLVTDGATLYGMTSNAIVTRGAVAPYQTNAKTIVDTIQGVGFADQVRLSNGNTIYCWIEGVNISTPVATGTPGFSLSYKILDSNGSEVTAGAVIDSINAIWNCRIVTDGTNWAIFYVIGATPTGLNSFSPVTGVQSLYSDVTSKALDATNTGSFAIGCYATGAGMKVFLFDLASGAVGSSAVIDATSTAYKCSAICVIGNVAYVAGNNSNGSGSTFRAMSVNASSLALVSGPNVIATSTAITSRASTVSLVPYQGGLLMGWSEDFSNYVFQGSSAGLGEMTFRRLTTAAAATGGYCYGSGMRPLSKVWVDDSSNALCLVSTNSGAAGYPGGSLLNPTENQDEVMLMSVNPNFSAGVTGAPVIKGKIDTLIGSFWRPFCLTQWVNAGTELQVLSPIVSSFDGYATRNAFRKVTITAPSSDPWRSVQVGGETVFFGSVLQAYDGDITWPYSFSFSPSIDWRGSFPIATGGSMPAGTYAFVVTPERRSAAGVLHRGPPSFPRSFITAGTTSSMVLKWTTIWDTPSSGFDSQVPELLIPYYIPIGGANMLRFAYNGQDWLNGKADRANPEKSTAIGSGSNLEGPVSVALYTASGELEDLQPPGMSTGCVYRNRIYAVDNTGTAVWFTKRIDQNPGIAPGWNPTNRLLFDQPVTALAVLDDRLIIFTARGIFVYASDGPELTGEYLNGGATQPNKLQTDVGCTNPRSVVSGMDGVYFQCGSDIQMLSRKLTVEWVGKQVQDELGTSPVITSAVLVEQMNQVRFTLASGATLVHDYVEGQWSKFLYLNGAIIVDAIMHDGAYTFVTSAGQVYKETAGVYTDDGVYVITQFETAEITAAGPIAYHNIRKVQFDGLSFDDHKLTVETAFNGEDAFTQSQVFASGINNATAQGAIAAVTVSMGTRRKCRSVRYRVTDEAPAAAIVNGRGAAWSAMGIEFGVNKGFGRLPARERM